MAAIFFAIFLVVSHMLYAMGGREHSGDVGGDVYAEIAFADAMFGSRPSAPSNPAVAFTAVDDGQELESSESDQSAARLDEDMNEIAGRDGGGGGGGGERRPQPMASDSLLMRFVAWCWWLFTLELWVASACIALALILPLRDTIAIFSRTIHTRVLHSCSMPLRRTHSLHA